MNLNPRQIKLIDVVRARGSVSVEQLSEELGVTLQTVRRDVQRLAEAGTLSRFHGGVRVPSSTIENIAHTQRQGLHAEGKARIARAVAAQVPNNCSLILNIGTTTEAIARALSQHTVQRACQGWFGAGQHGGCTNRALRWPETCAGRSARGYQ